MDPKIQPQGRHPAMPPSEAGDGEKRSAPDVSTAATVGAYLAGKAERLAKVAEDAAKLSSRTAQQARRLQGLSKWTGRGLGGLAAATTALDRYRHSPASTTVRKTADAAGSAAITTVFSAVLPAAAAVDALTGGHASKTLASGVAGSVAIIEGLVEGDERSMARFHTQALAGEYGGLVRAGAALGVKCAPEISHAAGFWSEHGFAGGIKEAYREAKSLLD